MLKLKTRVLYSKTFTDGKKAKLIQSKTMESKIIVKAFTILSDLKLYTKRRSQRGDGIVLTYSDELTREAKRIVFEYFEVTMCSLIDVIFSGATELPYLFTSE